MTIVPPFPAFFHALWGYDPYPWQSMLAERVAEDDWPAVLDLPTASGKTACLEIALYALAAQVERPTADRTAPRRVWFVVDRRIVVDEAYERAWKIAKRLEQAGEGPLREIADRLRAVAGTDRPLAVARLRGGVLRDTGWSRLPSQPALITSTVDQLGSRLLFRGYGHSQLAAPIYAGLAANDSLIVLDEAHCAVPFLQTLRSIREYRGPRWAEAAPLSPFGLVVLSATPPEGLEHDAFPGEAREAALAHPMLQQRLKAEKPATLIEVKEKHSSGADPLPAEAGSQAERYVADGKQRVAVMVNRVRTAQDIAAELGKRLDGQADIVLLTGRLRPFERDALVAQWSPFVRAASPEPPARPVVVVTTQCLEVGADFSFDALVTECASLDALRQRFGRLNRMGDPGAAPGAILARDRDADPAKAEPDPIYGAAIANTWQWLNTILSGATIDFGFEELRGAMEGVDLSACLAPSPDAPLLLPAHLDLLCQTAPVPAPDPDIQLFLHGKDRGAPEVQVVWRADLDEGGAETWLETVALCPPTGGEMLTVPLYRLRAFLARADVRTDGGDVEGVPEDQAESPHRARPFVLWRGRDRSEWSNNPAAISPGTVVVLPAAYGLGQLGQQMDQSGVGKGALDIWERTLEPAGKPPALRLTRAVLEGWRECPPVAELIEHVEEPEPDRDAIIELLDQLEAYEPTGENDVPPPEWWRALAGRARTWRRIEPHPAGGIIWRGRRSASETSEPDLFADDDDLTSAAGQEVGLEEHSDLVERTAVRVASHCLPVQFGEVVRLAAFWHDTGKLDERFQILLRGGDEMAAITANMALAKSDRMPEAPAARRAIREQSGLPAGFRHEMLSTQLAQTSVDPAGGAESTDLLLHLIASHHGHGRPFAPICEDSSAPGIEGSRGETPIALTAAQRAESVPAHRLDSGVAERFWRLVRRQGWWGLAYLEAVLRLADWYASGKVKAGAADELEGTTA